MKTTSIYRLIVITAFTGMLFSCKKSSSSNGSSATSSTDLQATSDDQTRVSTESDAAFDDVNTTMTSQASVTGSDLNPGIRHTGIEGGGGDTVKSYICDASVSLDTIDNPHTLTITYNGANCALDRTRTGSVVVSWTPGVRWSTAGAVVTVAFQNLAITRLSDNKTITLNGTHTYTNLSGGSLLSLPNNPGTSITHTITSSNMAITFDNGAKRNWNVARQRIYSFSGGYVITTSGTYTTGSVTGISEWGTDRFGNSFRTIIAQPRVISESCGWQMTAGEVQLSNTAGTTSITYGLNITGTATSCPVSGTYYFELSWTAAVSGKTYSVLLPY